MSTIHLRIPDDLKKAAQAVAEANGLDLSSCIRMFLHHVKVRGTIPLEPLTIKGLSERNEDRKIRRIRGKNRTLSAMKPTILRIAKEYGATNVRVFGSYARGDNGPDSDIDLLVTLPKTASLLAVAGLQVDLEEALRHAVDVIPDDSIKPMLREHILAEARAL